jgi:hypothetical protein
MNQRFRRKKKAYAMGRMATAIGRAMDADSGPDKDRAARWAAAWGAVGGIFVPGVRLRQNVLVDRRRTPR